MKKNFSRLQELSIGVSKWMLPIWIFLAVAGGAFAQTTGTTGNFIWSATNSQITINFYTNTTNTGAVTIPSTISVSGSDLPVTNINGYAFSDCTGLTSITIPNSVQSIGIGAFENCTGLTCVTIPNGVQSIPAYAFMGCTNLTTVTIPSNVFVIGSQAFYGCGKLQYGIFLGNSPSMGSSVFSNDASGFTVYYSSNAHGFTTGTWNGYPSVRLSSTTGTTENGLAWSSSSNQITVTGYSGTGTTVDIPSTINVSGVGLPVTKIGNSAFPTSSLTSVTMPSSITSIGAYAFCGCPELTSITIPASVTSIGAYAFRYCNGLSSVTIPSSVTSIGDQAFSNCINLYNVTFLGNAPSIGSTAFTNDASCFTVYYSSNASGFTTGTWNGYPSRMLSSTTGMTANGLAWSSSSNQITVTGYSGTGSTVIIPSIINVLGVDLPVTRIESSAFYGCSGLTSVTIPSSVTSIDSSAFSNCSSLQYAIFLGNSPFMDSSVFSNDASGFTAYYSSNASGFSTPTWNGYSSVMLSSTTGTTANGLAWSSSSNQITITGYSGPGSTVIIPGTINVSGVGLPVTSIGSGAFCNCYSLASLTIPNSVTSIGRQAFEYCYSLTSVIFPSSITRIGSSAFSNCLNLKYATFLGNAPGMGLSSEFPGAGNGFTINYFSNALGFTTPIWNGYPLSVTIIPPLVITTASPLAFGFGNITLTGSGGVPPYTWSITSGSLATGLSLSNTGVISGCLCEYSSGTFTLMAADAEGSSTTKNFVWVAPTSGTTVDGVVWSSSNQITITRYSGTATTVNIPSIINVWGIDLPVTSISGSGFRNQAGLTSVTIPNSVTSIGDYTFYNCTGLTNVTIPSNVTSIGNEAFFGCSGLTSLSIPGSVTSIGVAAFANCSGLVSLSVDASNPNYSSVNNALFDKNQTTLIQFPAGISGTYSVPNSVTSIGIDAFWGCSGLTGVTIPSSVISIKYCAFAYCSKLKNAIFLNDAPTTDPTAFSSVASGFAVYYSNVADGFTSSPWNTWSIVNTGTYSPVKPWLISNGFSYDSDLRSIPNFDGVPLLMSYALNLDPTQNQSRNLPKPYVSGSNLCLTYYASNSDISSYTVQTSTDMQNWTNAGVSLSGPDGNGCYTASIPMTAPRQFMRLVVTH